MTSPFFGLDTARRALQTEQTLVNVTNQNIANANTPGFSRQTAQLQATLSYPIPVFSVSGEPGQLGTGVEVTSITRARDTFLDSQVRAQMSSQGRWSARQTALSNVESIINEPSTTGISSLITRYFNSWQDVANNPSDPSARASMIQQGEGLATGFNNMVTQLKQQQMDLNQQVSQTVANINDYATQIANINKQVAQVETAGMKANDLRDQRDQLVDKLSSLVKVTSVENSDGEVSIYLGGQQLVDRSNTTQLQAVAPTGSLFVQPTWANGQQLNPGDGQLQGQIEARDQLLAGEIQSVNDSASRIITSVNALHQSGVDLSGNPGIPFFTGKDATDMALNAPLTGSGGTNYVAASRMAPNGSGGYTSSVGDSSNAQAIAELANSVATLDTTTGLGSNTTIGATGMTVAGVSVQGAASGTTYSYSWDSTNNTLQVTNNPGGTTSDVTATIVPNGSAQLMTVDGLGVRLTINVPTGTSLTSALNGLVGQQVGTTANPATIGNQYSQFVASLGVDSNTAQGESTNQQVLLDQLQQQRESVSGVSIDEETTNLIQYQRAYEAAAHVVTVIDSMLDTLINHTGSGT
jgi:flagellar hook-associated protein 1